MVQAALVGPLGYRSGQEMQARQRASALAAVVGLHVAVFGVFHLAQLRKPPPPPEPTLSVSFISEAPASAAAAPPQPTPPTPLTPTPPTPAPRLIATASETPSPMTAPPMEKQPPRDMVPPEPAAAPPPAPPAAAASAASTSTNAAVTPPNFTAGYLKNPGPAYPTSSRRRREEGTVRLRVQVSAEGAPTQVLIDRSSGSSDLDAAAQDVVKKRWRFAPAKQGDRAVSAWVVVPMEFSLKDR